MPIRKPSNESFWVVCLEDDALDDLPSEVMRAYESFRNFSELEPHLADLTDKPTRFYCRPLKPQYQRMVPALMIPEADADKLWDLFAAHVEKVDGLLDGDGREIPIVLEGKGDSRKVPEKYRGTQDVEPTIPMEVYREVAQVIIHKGTKSNDTPFSLQGIWGQSRMNRIRGRHACKEASALLERTAEIARIALSSESETSSESTDKPGAS